MCRRGLAIRGICGRAGTIALLTFSMVWGSVRSIPLFNFNSSSKPKKQFQKSSIHNSFDNYLLHVYGYDPLMRWDPSKYSNRTYMTVPRAVLWFPDIDAVEKLRELAFVKS